MVDRVIDKPLFTSGSQVRLADDVDGVGRTRVPTSMAAAVSELLDAVPARGAA